MKLPVLLVIPLLLFGCATAQRTNWDTRIGTFTYDEAVRELGPPETTDQLPDNTRAATWLVQRGDRGSLGYGMGAAFVTPGYTEAFPHYAPPTPDRFLRLVFAPDGRLTSWERFQAFRR